MIRYWWLWQQKFVAAGETMMKRFCLKTVSKRLDFEYAWKRVLDPSRDSAVVFMMYFFVGIRVLNDHTLEVTLLRG